MSPSPSDQNFAQFLSRVEIQEILSSCQLLPWYLYLWNHVNYIRSLKFEAGQTKFNFIKTAPQVTISLLFIISSGLKTVSVLDSSKSTTHTCLLIIYLLKFAKNHVPFHTKESFRGWHLLLRVCMWPPACSQTRDSFEHCCCGSSWSTRGTGRRREQGFSGSH